MTSPVLLILGFGPNVGTSVAKKFASRGYQVAVASRKTKSGTSPEDYLSVQTDLGQPDQVRSAFHTTKQKLGTPDVVVYNASATTRTEAESPLSLPLDTIKREFFINFDDLYAAAQGFVNGAEASPNNSGKVFIDTGNALNVMQIPGVLSLGVGKSAGVYLINTAAEAYRDKGYSFYYADERTSEGAPVYASIDGEAHGEFYYELSQKVAQDPWLATFVKGKGYVEFARK